MKQVLPYSLLVILLFLGSSCRSRDKERDIAKEFCQCFQEMTTLYQQTREITEDSDELIALTEKLQTAATASKECIEEAEIDFTDVIDEKEEEIKAAMKKICPKVVETLEEIDKGYE
jgi:hypothetical protein